MMIGKNIYKKYCLKAYYYSILYIIIITIEIGSEINAVEQRFV